MSFLRQNKDLFPFSTRRYLHFQNNLRIAYNILFHAQPAGKRPPFHLKGANGFGYSYVISGNGTLTDKDGNTHLLEPGSLFEVNPETFGQLVVAPDQDWYECSLSMSIETMQALASLGVIVENKIHVKSTPQDALAEAYLHAYHVCESHQHDPSASSSITQAIINIFIKRQQMIDEQQDAFTRRALSLLRETCQERDSIESVAQALDMNYHAFRKRLMRTTGHAPKVWQIRYRVQRACDLLLTYDIASVAEQLGYADRFVFSRQFRQTTGKTPGQMQREIRSATSR